MTRQNPGDARARRWIVALPLLWLIVFFLLPFSILVKISLSEAALAQPPYRPVFDWAGTWAAWRAAFAALGLDSYRTLVADDLYWSAVLSSVRIAATATLLLALVGYPIAYAMARAPARWRPVLVALVVLPFWTSFLIRIYAWIAILKPEGFLNQVLLALGVVDEPLQILNTEAAIQIGLVYAYLPFMILPVYAGLARLDPALLEASEDLGVPPWRGFWLVTFPLSRPGLVAGALLCFIPIVGEFVVPDLLGGSETLMIGRVLWSEFFSNRDWPLASAVAVAMLAVVVGPLVAFRNAETRRLERQR